MENSRSFVWGSEIDVDSVSMHRLTLSVHFKKKSEANCADPIGWPRRRQPSVSSTGIVSSGIDGWGVLEKFFIVLSIDVPKLLFFSVMSGIGDVPLQDVRIRVLDVFTKQPRSAPCDCRVWQRNSRSGR
jgi:hypothetical protein